LLVVIPAVVLFNWFEPGGDDWVAGWSSYPED
jgi:hypothetical protein